ncbi:hypothetical protein KUCAC02_021708 [Chaenocephalus aceratus]|uniref:Uncharacterized protein n=1 Tax=Chaenocephalus aceratus TaxID=36190 RepID=A0ACB9XG65_CHAAC|nr:hypothetical protein KUCAC02_021708 [Chaenocephalus aceratus]
MPNFAGTWKMKRSENFDELLKALGKPRPSSPLLFSHPSLSSASSLHEINFQVGEEYDEETVDGRKCKSLATWETENKMVCKQTLVDGNGPKTYWTRELSGDELILTFGADDVVCTRIYARE